MWDFFKWCWDSLWSLIAWIVGGIVKIICVALSWAGELFMRFVGWFIDQYFAMLRTVFAAYPFAFALSFILGVLTFFLWNRPTPNSMNDNNNPSFGRVIRGLIIAAAVPFFASFIGATATSASTVINDHSVHQNIQAGRDVNAPVNQPAKDDDNKVAWTDVLVAGIGAAGVLGAAWIGAKEAKRRKARKAK